MKELPKPPSVVDDEKARELVRVWAAHGRQHVTIATGLWDDPAAWGMMLVDLAKHVADAYEQQSQRNYQDSLRRIKAGFDAEWSHATDTPTGHVMD